MAVERESSAAVLRCICCPGVSPSATIQFYCTAQLKDPSGSRSRVSNVDLHMWPAANARIPSAELRVFDLDVRRAVLHADQHYEGTTCRSRSVRAAPSGSRTCTKQSGPGYQGATTSGGHSIISNDRQDTIKTVETGLLPAFHRIDSTIGCTACDLA